MIHDTLRYMGYRDDVDFTVHAPQDVQWVVQNPPTQAEIEAAILPAKKTTTLAAISEYANTVRAKYTAGVSGPEMSSWSVKRNEAIAYTASGNAADAPMLSIEAADRGIPLQDIVARVMTNASALSALEAHISGTAGKHRDAIKAGADPNTYDWHVGWPG